MTINAGCEKKKNVKEYCIDCTENSQSEFYRSTQF